MDHSQKCPMCLCTLGSHTRERLASCVLELATDLKHAQASVRELAAALKEASSAIAQARAEEREACALVAEDHICGCGDSATEVARRIRRREAEKDAEIAKAVKERDQLWARSMMGSQELEENHPIRVMAESYIAQARAEEREACAKIADIEADRAFKEVRVPANPNEPRMRCEKIAAAIIARTP